MAFFIPSSIQKRLLRYALSRLDLFDSDALNPDRLDIGLGRNSKIELKDVKLQKDKLAALLQLPETVNIVKAKANVLRLIIPADIHATSIQIEVQGVEVDLRLKDDTPIRDSTTNLHDEALPSTHHLAKSFLDQEPEQEKRKIGAELGADLGARRPNLAQSVSSNTSSDEDSVSGTAAAWALPTFLADFLQGVVNRLQLTIQDVTLSIVLNHDLADSTKSSAKSDLDFWETSLSVSIGHIDVPSIDPLQQRDSVHYGKRCINLESIQGSLLAHPRVWALLSHRPETQHNSPAPQTSPTHSFLRPASPHTQTQTASDYLQTSRLTSSQQTKSGSAIAESTTLPNYSQTLGDSFLSSDGGNQADIEDDDSDANSFLTDRTPFVRHRQAQVSDPFFDGIDDEAQSSMSSSVESYSNHMHKSLRSFREERTRMSTNSQPSLSRNHQESPSPIDQEFPTRTRSPPPDLLHDDSSNTTPIEERNLAESTMFSHEDAESIYMSVISDALPSSMDNADASRGISVPGGWQESPESSFKDTSQIPREVPPETSKSDNIDVAQEVHLLNSINHSTTPLSASHTGSARPDSEERLPSKTMLSRKTIFKIEQTVIWLPPSDTDTKTSADNINAEHFESMGSSRKPDQNAMPGAFSVYAAESLIGTEPKMFGEITINDSIMQSSVQRPSAFESPIDTSVDVSVGPVVIRLDASLCRLMALLTTKFHKTFQPTIDTASKKHSKKTVQQSRSWKLKIHNIDLKVLEQVAISRQASTIDVTNDRNSILGIALYMIDFSMHTAIDVQILKLGVGKLAMYLEHEEIISISRQTNMRTSLRDIKELSHQAIAVTFRTSNDQSEINVSTLPVALILDLQRFDDALSTFGGFSGLIELGSSVLSDASIVTEKAKPINRSRTVRFEAVPEVLAPSPLPQVTPPQSFTKVNVRIAGATMRMASGHCYFTYQSSAIKVVLREALIGAQIDEVRLAGPYSCSTTIPKEAQIVVRNLGVKYLYHPEEHDLTRLISLLTPSNDRFEEEDDYLVDTLIRQRRRGTVLRVSASKIDVEVQDLEAFDTIQESLLKAFTLPNLTRYLPKESRPGSLVLLMLQETKVSIDKVPKLGQITFLAQGFELAQVSAPALLAIGISVFSANRTHFGPMVRPLTSQNKPDRPLMLMVRMIGDELEPTLKLKLWNVCFEYSVPLLIAIMGLQEDADSKEVSESMATSVATLTDTPSRSKSQSNSSPRSKASTPDSKPLNVDLTIRDCAIGLTPRYLTSKGLLVLTNVRITCLAPETSFRMKVELKKASLLLIDDTSLLERENSSIRPRAPKLGKEAENQVPELCSRGFVDVAYVSAATVVVSLVRNIEDETFMDIEVGNRLLVLDTCADSTQTLTDLFAGLKPPSSPSKDIKYRTQVAPMQDMLASFTGDAFTEQDTSLDGHSGVRNYTDMDDEEDLDFLDDVPSAKTAGRSNEGSKWDSANNRYISVMKSELRTCPIKARLRDIHFIWNLYDGYDWQKTRNKISQAVADVEMKAEEKRLGQRKMLEDADDDTSAIGDFLFNSIYIGVPTGHDPHDLTRQINRNVDDLVSETGSQSSTVTARPANIRRTSRPSGKRLKLDRSRRHKIAFELKDICADILVFPPGGETQTSIDVRIGNLEIFDHVPTSTWKKFLTYMQDAGWRQDRPMVHLEICEVRPVPNLSATELVIRATVLPLRLHVDQDALDFMTRFFDFHDDSPKAVTTPEEQAYIQRIEVRPVPLKLDYKPKKVDYAGLRSGRTKEFMNFFILDGADMILKHTIIYGISNLGKLHQSLEDIWMPDIKKNQLPGVLAGLNGVRTLVNVGTGVRDLVVIPIREYRKDGKVVRSISKGALSFARNTGGELTRFGAKLAVGAHAALQGAEGLFMPANLAVDREWDDGELEPEERRLISRYADQPAGILQGLRNAASSLERDLLMTKDIIIAVAGEVRESDSAEGVARAVVRHAPTLILRPMIGASKAISQTLMGATNTMDPQNRRRLDDKYKH